VNKKLSERYSILHKAKGVTFRGLFVVNPNGILKFSATCPLEVERSTREVEMIIRVLKRSRELSHLKELERAKELSKYKE
jgi:peroxiredoxin (alkyl hydroperoxide reductase subunit C)